MVKLEDLKSKNITEEEFRKDDYNNSLFFKNELDKNEQAIVDYFYLQREVLDVDYHINEERIRCKSNTSLHIDVISPEYINIDELLKNRKNIVKFAKENNISVSYKMAYKKQLENYKKEYDKEYKKALDMFNELKERWEYIRDVRKLHMGLKADYYYNETTDLKWKYEKTFLPHHSIIAKVSNIKDELENIENMLKDDDVVVSKIYM